MIASIMKALGFSLGCSCPMNCPVADKTATPINDTIITTVVLDKSETAIDSYNSLSRIQDISKIYTI